MVGAPGFEPGASCAQVRRSSSWKSFLFNLSFENKRVREIFGSGTMYGHVAPHAWSPPNFPHSEERAKCFTPEMLSYSFLKRPRYFELERDKEKEATSHHVGIRSLFARLKPAFRISLGPSPLR